MSLRVNCSGLCTPTRIPHPRSSLVYLRMPGFNLNSGQIGWFFKTILMHVWGVLYHKYAVCWFYLFILMYYLYTPPGNDHLVLVFIFSSLFFPIVMKLFHKSQLSVTKEAQHEGTWLTISVTNLCLPIYLMQRLILVFNYETPPPLHDLHNLITN